MARIRTIKPQAFTSKTLSRASHSARWTFAGLWTHCDDKGRCEDDTRIIKGVIWPQDDDVTHAHIAGHLDELAALGLICRYTVAGKDYLHVVNWDEHQPIPRPGKPRHPECPKPSHRPPDPAVYPSANAVHPNTSQSHVSAGSRKKEVGDRKKEEQSIVELPADEPDAAPPPPAVAAQARPVARPEPADVRTGFELWREVTGHHDAKLLDKRRRALQRAFKTHPRDDVLDAIRGIALSPWHMGDNDRNRRFDDLHIILKDENFEHFRDLQRDGPPPRASPAVGKPVGKRTRQLLDTAAEMRRYGIERGLTSPNGMAGMGDDRRQAQRELPDPADRTADSG